ncbi:MAG: DUF5367 family protein [Bacillaceae bacterium]|nr:DUF5367 family protein [Bacillaceae bacterium]
MIKYGYTVVWGGGVWLFAILFFVFFGERVLYQPGTYAFYISTVLLLIGTGVLLLAVTYLYLRFDRSVNASLKFGVIGTIVGLFLDTFSLLFHRTIFPDLDESRVIAFTVWMSFAYALYLLIPAVINERMKNKYMSAHTE